MFQTTLEADLVAKTFLFVGFSFADPNLNYLLGHLRTLLDENQHQHFAVMRRVRRNYALGEEGERRFEYDRNKQDLLIRELQRYNIQTHLIDRFSDVADILHALEDAALRKKIFVSGSANKFTTDFSDSRMRDFCMHFGELLMSNGCRLISGFGLNIGDSVIKGAVLQLYDQRSGRFEAHVLLRPFPRNLPTNISEGHFLDEYRRDMIAQSGFAVFISGTSRTSPVSRGVMEEYEIARALGTVPIAIGRPGSPRSGSGRGPRGA